MMAQIQALLTDSLIASDAVEIAMNEVVVNGEVDELVKASSDGAKAEAKSCWADVEFGPGDEMEPCAH